MSEALATRPVGLLKVEEARQLLAECKQVDEVRPIRDKAEAVRQYLRQQHASRDAQNDAAEIKLRAERRLGELLAEQKKAGERHDGHSQRRSESQREIPKLQAPVRQKPGQSPPPPTLKDLGITLNQSSRWQEIAKVPEKKFEAFIADQREKSDGEITTSGLRREHVGEVRRQERVEKIIETSRNETPIATIPNCPVLLADPPWRYEHAESENRAIENQYPTMDLDAICALRPPAAQDAVLFLWATSPKLEEALRVLNAWGFSYRTCAVWVKDKLGMGYWFRQQHELLLVGVRGSFPPPPPDMRVSSVITSERTEHSAKPEEVPTLIERAYPTLPRVELFARKPRDGWHVWGNEVSA